MLAGCGSIFLFFQWVKSTIGTTVHVISPTDSLRQRSSTTLYALVKSEEIIAGKKFDVQLILVRDWVTEPTYKDYRRGDRTDQFKYILMFHFYYIIDLTLCFILTNAGHHYHD